MSESPRATVYFDGTCPLCRREIGVYQRCAGAESVAWVDVSQPGAPADDLDRETALARFHVRAADGRLVSGAAGFLELWRSLPGWRWLGIALSVPPLPWILERGYRGFLRIRPMIARRLER